MCKVLLFTMMLIAVTSCSSEDFVGDKVFTEASGEKTISFGTSTGKITRAEGSAAASILGNSFNVYATKTVNSAVSNVFAKNEYGTGDDYNASPYLVSWTTNTAGTTASNTSDWEYVNGNDQTIKFWDYAASKYEFVAYKATVENTTITKYKTSGFTVEATAAQLAGLYIADKVTITEANNSPSTPGTVPANETKIGDVVQFTFRSAAAKVRLGIYETIPGYEVKNVKFRPKESEFEATVDNAKLSGSFNGTSSGASGTYTVTYNATTGIAELATSAYASNNFDFGTFGSSSNALGVTSTSPTWATGSSNYQSVFPNQDHTGNMILKVDYDLYNSVTGEIISVKGATAVVPAIYMKWNPNYAYTYLFKISDNTNGTTGTEGTSPQGLYPITFDALTVAATDGAEVGTITTVSTPAITTYQEGSVSDAGIAYTASDKPIYITVITDGTLAGLTAENTKLYTVEAGTTESDLMLSSKEKTSETSLSILSGDETVNSVIFASGKTAKFTPTTGATYALEYTDETTSYYKIIVVTGN